MCSMLTWLGRHRRSVGGGAIFLVGSALLAYVVFDLGHLAEKRRFAAIEPGMTEEQVLATLGPPGQYGPAGARYGRGFWVG